MRLKKNYAKTPRKWGLVLSTTFYVYYTKAFTANNINNNPAKIFKIFVGNFFNVFPSQKPSIVFMKVTSAISAEALKIETLSSAKPIPAARASMLVAIAIANKHFKSRHFNSSHSDLIASFIILSPKSKNIVKTIHFENGSSKSV